MAGAVKKAAKGVAKKAAAGKDVARPAAGDPRTVDVLSVLHPGKTYKRDALKYALARKAFLAFMPKAGAGLTQAEMGEAMRKALPDFGSTAGWWMKTVQLDAEARGEIARDGGKPLRWKKVR
jgi:hypothetical protein